MAAPRDWSKVGDTDQIDQWFEAKTKGLNDRQKDELKKQWGTMQNVLTSRARMDRVVADIVFDFAVKPRLSSERGNAILVASSTYEACKYFALFCKTVFKGHLRCPPCDASVATPTAIESGWACGRLTCSFMARWCKGGCWANLRPAPAGPFERAVQASRQAAPAPRTRATQP